MGEPQGQNLVGQASFVALFLWVQYLKAMGTELSRSYNRTLFTAVAPVPGTVVGAYLVCIKDKIRDSDPHQEDHDRDQCLNVKSIMVFKTELTKLLCQIPKKT